MTSDPYAAGYTFARSAFTGGPTRDQKAVRTIYIYIYIYIYTDSEIIVLTRWGSLRLAPINIADKSGLASARPIIMFQAVRRAVVGGVSDPQVK